MPTTKIVDAAALSDGERSTRIAFAVARSRPLRKNLGYFPKAAYEDAASRDRMTWLDIDDQVVAFAVYGPTKSAWRIYQIFVQDDARKIDNGRSLLDHIIARGGRQQKHEAACWCASDLAENLFWLLCGFRPVAQREGSDRLRRRHICWARPINSAARLLPGADVGPTAPLAPPSPLATQAHPWPATHELARLLRQADAAGTEFESFLATLPTRPRKPRLVSSAATIAKPRPQSTARRLF